ncbi:SH3 domain-containing protein 21 [Suncus etruscus]|uniref:SH3 domain-containing protein 21 n=1 Tax=Suncus etruscus TaxID=109475 RepID=UPI0021102E8D|nr:SH3 domain-containing protein 21 [Suncus etruscus]
MSCARLAPSIPGAGALSETKPGQLAGHSDRSTGSLASGEEVQLLRATTPGTRAPPSSRCCLSSPGAPSPAKRSLAGKESAKGSACGDPGTWSLTYRLVSPPLTARSTYRGPVLGCSGPTRPCPSGSARAPRKLWVCAEGLGWLFWATGKAPGTPARPAAVPSCSALSRAPPCPPAEVLVLATYRAQKEGELSLAPGDVVRQVCPGPTPGWLRGELGGRSGLFPEGLVQEIPESLRGTGEAQRPRGPRRRGHLAKSWDPPRWCKVHYNYIPEQTDELELRAGEIVEVIKEIEDGWWLGKKNGKLGALPSNFVELLDCGPPSLSFSDKPSIIPDLEQPPKLYSQRWDDPPEYQQTAYHPEYYKVLFDYQPKAPDELALRKGDMVKVLKKTTEDEGWWEGESQGRKGVFPDNFVVLPPPIKKLTRQQIPQDSVKTRKPKKMMLKTILPAAKRMGTATSPLGPNKNRLSWTPKPDGESTRHPSGWGGGRQCRDPSLTPLLHLQKGKQSSQAKAAAQTKTPRLDKPGTLKRTRQSDKSPTLRQRRAPEKTLTPEETPTLEDKTSYPDRAFSVEETPEPEDLALPELGDPFPGMGVSPEQEASSPDNPQACEPSLEEAMPLVAIKAQSPGVLTPEGEDTHPVSEHSLEEAKLPVAIKAQSPRVLMPERSPREETTPSSDDTHPVNEPFLEEAKPPVATKAQSPGVLTPEGPPPPTTEHLLANGETTLKEGSPKEATPSGEDTHPVNEPSLEEATLPVAIKAQSPRVLVPEGSPREEATPSGDDAHPVKLTPHLQESSTVHAPAAPNSIDVKYDNSILQLTEEVKTLKASLELMGKQLERKLSDLWEELKREKESRQSLEVQLGLRTQEPAAPSTTATATSKQTQTEDDTPPVIAGDPQKGTGVPPTPPQPPAPNRLSNKGAQVLAPAVKGKRCNSRELGHMPNSTRKPAVSDGAPEHLEQGRGPKPMGS